MDKVAELLGDDTEKNEREVGVVKLRKSAPGPRKGQIEVGNRMACAGFVLRKAFPVDTHPSSVF